MSLGKQFVNMQVALTQAAGGATVLKDTFMGMGKGAEGTFGMQKEAIIGLNNSMVNFSEMGMDQRKELAERAVLFSRLGVSAETSGKPMQDSMLSLGMTAEDAMDSQLELAAVAKELGIPTGKMMESFASMMPDLAKFGKSAGKEFKRLQIIAKKTGIETDKLMSLWASLIQSTVLLRLQPT